MGILERIAALALLAIALAIGCSDADHGPDDAAGSGGTGGAGEGDGGTGGSGGVAVRSGLPCDEDADCSENRYCVDRDGEKTCESLCLGDDACPAGAHCLQAARGATVCSLAPVHDACAVDDDCPGGWVCVDRFCQLATECSSAADCDDGESCSSGSCFTPDGNPCTTTRDCYGDLGYCAATDPTTCLTVACGDFTNSCGRCALGPNGGAPDGSGPLVIAVRRTRVAYSWCVRDPERCLPGATPYVCEFAFHAYDPDGDFPMEDLGRYIQLVDRDGTLLDTFDASITQDPEVALVEYRFRGCFPDTVNHRITPAVVLADQAGHHSQTQCIDLDF